MPQRRTIPASEFKAKCLALLDEVAQTRETLVVTQRGTKMMPGRHVYVGRTHSLHAAIDGRVKFERKAEGRVHVSVEPLPQAAE